MHSVNRFLLVVVLWICLLSGVEAYWDRSCPKCEKGDVRLKAVSMLFRHGDRSPTETYPLDPYKDYNWPNGPGALSPLGAKQLYESGLIKSTRYSSLFSTECPSNEVCRINTDRISILSSSVQRCIDSVISFLDGFLRVEWPADMILVIPHDEDEMLAFPGKTCPRYPSVFTPVNNPRFNRIIDFNGREGQNLIGFLENNTGMTFETTREFLLLEDALLIQDDNGLPLPEWAQSVWQRYLIPLSNAVFDIVSETALVRTRSAALLRDMIARLNAVKEGTTHQNILLYSAHDITVAGMFGLLGVREEIGIARPQYGSALNLELYENTALGNNDYEVRLVYYSHHAVDSPTDVNIPGCKKPCRFVDFVHRFSAKLTKSFDEICDV